jgi:deoxycytidylate deaminase
MATDHAVMSPCTRRQYATVIVNEGMRFEHYIGINERVSKCCDGNACARDRLGLHNGERVEVGAEVHSETAALIKAGKAKDTSAFILVGFANGEELFGKSVYPCHSCAVQIKWAGYKRIYIKESADNIITVPIQQIIEEREQAWQF